jgi:hypothetical protein
MKAPAKALALLGILALSGCCKFEPKRINDVSVGMTKEQVQDRLCKPEWTRAEGASETLHYKAQGGERFFVRLKNGLVEAFGRGVELLRPDRPQGQREPGFRVTIRE